MANPQLPIGVQTSIPPTGTNAPTSLNYPSFVTSHGGWEIANPAGAIIAWAGRYQTADNTNGWANGTFPSSNPTGATGGTTFTSFPLTPPTGTPIAAGYEIRAANTNGPAGSAFFDVVAAATVVRRLQPRVVIF